MTPEEQRQNHRRTVADCTALVDLLQEWYPPAALPQLNASDREIGAWLAERRLVQRLTLLLKESREGTGGQLPKVLGG